jgi:tripartite-type tricarboxylate transporter receptor subunit TctC
LLAMPHAALTQTYPSRPITIVVPLAPGGAVDALARNLAEHMTTTLGQPVIIENVTGAGGSVGVARVARAVPDGYTVGTGTASQYVGSAAIYPVQYDLLKDFEPVVLLPSVPYWIVAKATLPVKDLKELIAWLKANSDKASAGAVGVGMGSHLCGIMLQQNIGTKFQMVPYRGGAPALQDLVAGQVDLMCDLAANSLAHARAGRVKPLAVLAKERWFAAPDVPTADEAGIPGFYVSTWHGLWVPKGTPREIVDKLNSAAVAAMADPGVRRRIADQGMEIPPLNQQTPEALGAYHKAEVEKWVPIIKAANIKPD